MRPNLKEKLDALFNEHLSKGQSAVAENNLNASTYELGYITAIREVMQIIWMKEVL